MPTDRPMSEYEGAVFFMLLAILKPGCGLSLNREQMRERLIELREGFQASNSRNAAAVVQMVIDAL